MIDSNEVLLSIIVPVYGVEKYINDCAASIFEQSIFRGSNELSSNVEIIFVDDCSKDNSISILRKLINKYPIQREFTQILTYDQNRGLAGARKFGLENALGKYVLQVDSDDYLQHDMISVMLSKAIKEDADIVMCDLNVIRGDEAFHEAFHPNSSSKELMKQIINGEIHASVCNKLIRRSLYTMNGISPTPGLNMYEDFSVMYKLVFFSQKNVHIPEPYYCYRKREASYTTSIFSKSVQENIISIIKQMDNFFLANGIKDNALNLSRCYYKAFAKIEIMIRGNPTELNSDLFSEVKLKHILFHPNITKKRKLLGLCTYFNFRLINRFVAFIVKQIDLKRFGK